MVYVLAKHNMTSNYCPLLMSDCYQQLCLNNRSPADAYTLLLQLAAALYNCSSADAFETVISSSV